MSARTIFVAIALIWIAFAILGALLHVVKLLLYIALLATVALVVIGAMTTRSRLAGGR